MKIKRNTLKEIIRREIFKNHLNEIIRKCGSKWCLYSHKGKKLGTHDSKKDATNQERAIKASGG